MLLDIIKLVIFAMTSIAFTFLSITLAKKESRAYALNTRETILVFFMSIMFMVWLLISNWNASNWYAIILLNICFSVLSVSFYIDIKLQELPDRITLIVMVCSIAILMQPSVWAAGLADFSARFILAAVVTGICFIFSIKTENLGMGDVKLLFPMLLMIGVDRTGVAEGYKIMYYLYNVLIPAFIVSIGYLAIYRKKDLKIAFGPFLILGFVLTFSVFPTSIFLV